MKTVRFNIPGQPAVTAKIKQAGAQIRSVAEKVAKRSGLNGAIAVLDNEGKPLSESRFDELVGDQHTLNLASEFTPAAG